LGDRASQQGTVAELALRALEGMELDALLDEAAAVVARELGVDRVAILERTGDGAGLLARSGVGLPDGVLGGVLPPDPSQLQRDLGSASRISARIGVERREFGVIEAHGEASGFSDEDQAFIDSVGAVLGAAAQRARHDELVTDSEARFRELADTTPALMWMTDAEGDVTFVNEGWRRFTGTTFEEELGPSWELGVHPEDAALTTSTWDAARAERRPWEREYRLRHHSGEYRWIVDRGRPRFVGGRYVGYVGTAIDIHERKTMERRLLEVYAREHEIAETLQRSLLPERLPPVEGLELAARYLPGARGAAIGGDWYDVLERPDGRVALVVGDVAGHGLRAAASMGQLRNAFRAYGLVEHSPADVVARINRLVMSGGEQVMATVLYLVLDRETGEVSYSAAGHPPPLVIAPDGPHFLEGGRSVPIGAADPAVFREATAVLPPGSSLLLYTDGLVERRDVSLGARLDELAEAAGAAGGGLDELCERVIATVIGGGELGDDVALLAVRPLPASGTQVSLTLPAEPGSLAPLRRRLARFLHATGASEMEQYEVTLTICEAAGNAIEHAYGPGDATYEVEIAYDAGELVATVRDAGSWREKRGEHRGRGLSIIEELMDEVAVERDEDGTLVRMRRRLGDRRAA
jgi:PAS domain S-box-containing protein